MPPASSDSFAHHYMGKPAVVPGGKKGRIMSLLDKKIEDYVSKIDDNQEIVLEYEDIFEYDFPYENTVPEDYYYSQIVDIKKLSDRYKNSYYLVYYKVFRTIMYDRWQGNYISEIPYHHICQKYEKYQPSYNLFCSSMFKATGKRKFSREDLIGVNEVFHLTYPKDGCIGTITERKPVDISPDWFDGNF